jgi:hypothetical protein
MNVLSCDLTNDTKNYLRDVSSSLYSTDLDASSLVHATDDRVLYQFDPRHLGPCLPRFFFFFCQAKNLETAGNYCKVRLFTSTYVSHPSKFGSVSKESTRRLDLSETLTLW